jgi:hypothetical protein
MGKENTDRLLDLPANEVTTWVRAVRLGERSTGKLEDGEWRLVASSAGRRARRATDAQSIDEALIWADFALVAYEQIPDESAQLGAMLLRAVLVKVFGPRPGDHIRDPEMIFAWCLDATRGVSPSEALSRSQSIKEALPGLSSDPIRSERLAKESRPLRLIKNRLGVAAVVVDRSDVRIPPAILEWLDFRERLP